MSTPFAQWAIRGGLGQKYWWVIFWSIWPLQYLIQMVLTYFALKSRITTIFITLNLKNLVKMAKIAFFGIFTVNFMYLNLIRLSSPVYMFSEMSYILGFYQFWDHKWTPLLPVWNGRHFLATKMIIFMFFNCKTTKNTTQLTFFQWKYKLH